VVVVVVVLAAGACVLSDGAVDPGAVAALVAAGVDADSVWLAVGAVVWAKAAVAHRVAIRVAMVFFMVKSP
jgi:hypothetical protein